MKIRSLVSRVFDLPDPAADIGEYLIALTWRLWFLGLAMHVSLWYALRQSPRFIAHVRQTQGFDVWSVLDLGGLLLALVPLLLFLASRLYRYGSHDIEASDFTP